MITIVGIDAL